jgi:VWFA-related protein
MRPLTTVFCAAALLALAGYVIAQEQGPLKEPGATVSKKRSADPNANPTDPASTAPAPSDQPKIPSQYKRNSPTAGGDVPTFKSDVDVVTLDVAVIDPRGQFIPGIPPGNFRVLEDNVPQQIRKVDMGQAPMTLAMVIEFSNKFQQLYSWAWFQTLELSWGFVSTLKPEDYVAIIAYDMHPEILSDFTTDRNKTQEALHRLTIPAWREANMFDAVTDTAERMSGIEGRKAILLITTGIDTFSKMTYDQCRKKLQEAGVPVYSISLMGLQREMADAYMGPMQRMDFLQADNELRTFAKETGGGAFFPKFQGEYGSVFQNIHQALRNQYVITYSPTNKAHDGTFRKLKVELVDPNGKPLPVKDEKGKPMKYQVLAKSGYKAPREVE